MTKICIISHFAYGAFAGGKEGHAGGVERQTTLMANWLSEHGYRVSLITWDEGQADGADLNGIVNYKLCKQSDGIPIVRFFYPRWTSLLHALIRSDADLYYHNCAEYVTGQVALWCRLNRRKFIFSVPSDPDCDSRLPKMKSFREKFLYKYGLRNASKIIVQTQTQQAMLESGFGLSSTVIPMPCPTPQKPESENVNEPVVRAGTVLWIGRISKEKQLELLLDVAETLPDIQFVVAGKPKQTDDYVKHLLDRAQTLDNVKMLGMVPRKKMDDLYSQASLLCCTSHYEGFPNTFLEAWSHGLPVISTVDPDGVINRYGLGVTADQREKIADAINALFGSQEMLQTYSTNARSYFEKYHTLDSSMEKFDEVFMQALELE